MSEETLKFQSSRFGEQEVAVESVITLVEGIIGFPDDRKYVLLDYNPPFSWLHSVKSPELAFVVVNGAEFGDHYQVPLPKNDPELALDDDPDYAIVNIVSIRSQPAPTTVNLKAPIIVNLKNMIGRQIVIDSHQFPTRFPLWPEGEDGEDKEQESK